MLPFVFDQPLRTDRLVLRPIAAHDFDDIHAYMSRDDVARWLLEDAYTLEQSREKHPSYARRVRFDADDDLILIAMEHDGRVIGDFDLTAKSLGDELVEIGWRIHPDFEGRGLATEGATAVLDLAFDVVGARRAIASLDARNTASARLCERLGMRREAHFIKEMFFKGEWADTLAYGILATEWHARRHPES